MIYHKRLKWALRKVFLPINKSALVLDVGSGGNPFPRSDILLDRMSGDEHRLGESMLIDRPTVFANANRMPFKDNAFDFVIASHILEHISEPELFLNELQRVGKAGYIETPNAIFERLQPFEIHCLEILDKDGVLYINKKSEAIVDRFLGKSELLNEKEPWGQFMFQSPEMFHVQYFWNEKINYEVINPDVSSDWIEEINNENNLGSIKDNYLAEETGWRSWGLASLNLWYKRQRKKRLKDFDLFSIMQCPECSGDIKLTENKINCSECNQQYKIIDGIPKFT